MASAEFTTEELENEIWKDVVGYEGIYSVSNLGRIRRDETKLILKRSPKAGGYWGVALCSLGVSRQIMWHIVVCRAFHGEKPTRKHTDVNHKDLDKSNNRADNLEWQTRSENILHSQASGNHPLGQNRPSAKSKDVDIPVIRKRVADGEPVAHIARDYGVGDHTIHRIRKGLKWTHIK